MAPRPIGPFLETPGSYGRRPHTLFWVFMLILLLVVVFVIFKVIPQGPVEAISDRQARKKMAEAEKLESQSLNYFAAEIYNNIVDSTRVGSDLRVKAARSLARVNREMPGHAEAVVAALEKAYYFSSPGPDKDGLREELENYTGHPLTSVIATPGAAGATSATLPAAAPPSSPAATAAVPRDSRPLARIGDETVGLDEVYSAWVQFNGQRKPGTDELRRFIRVYMDMIMLAGEARHRGMDRTPEALYDQRVHRVYYLSNALTEKLIKDLSTPDAKTLEEYYRAHSEQFMTPAKAVLGRIVVAGKDTAAKVSKALAQGQKFDRVARQYSADASQLQNGYLLGTISQNDPGVPELGANPRFVARLLALDAGVTTGPLESPRGLQFLHIVEKTPSRLQPFGDVQESVLFSYQKQQLTQHREALLRQLRQDHPIEPLDPSIRKLIEMEPASAAASTTTTAANSNATSATAAAPAPAPAEPPATTATLAAAPQAEAAQPQDE